MSVDALLITLCILIQMLFWARGMEIGDKTLLEFYRKENKELLAWIQEIIKQQEGDSESK